MEDRVVPSGSTVVGVESMGPTGYFPGPPVSTLLIQSFSLGPVDNGHQTAFEPSIPGQTTISLVVQNNGTGPQTVSAISLSNAMEPDPKSWYVDPTNQILIGVTSAPTTIPAGGHVTITLPFSTDKPCTQVDILSTVPNDSLAHFGSTFSDAPGAPNQPFIDSLKAPTGTSTIAGGIYCPTTGDLQSGDTATIGFWHNKNGQALINSLNGGPNSTNLASWLTMNFPNLYPSSLIGTTNSSVASYFTKIFEQKGGPKTEAQILGVALATYVTDSTLAGGNYAAAYGFNVSTLGTGYRTYTDNSGGAALIGLPNNTSLSVLDYLFAANAKASNGTIFAGNTSARGTVESLFDGINSTGDIK